MEGVFISENSAQLGTFHPSCESLVGDCVSEILAMYVKALLSLSGASLAVAVSSKLFNP